MLTHLTFTATDGKSAELRAVLTPLILPSRAEKGCIQYDMYQSHENPHRFEIFEEWTSEEDLANHCQSPHFLTFKANCDGLIASKSIEILDPLV